MISALRGQLRQWVARPASGMWPQRVRDRCGHPMRSCRYIGAGPATRFGPATLMRSRRLASSKVRDVRGQLSQQGNVAIKRAAVPILDHMKASSCQAGSSSRQTGGMVLRMRWHGSPDEKDHGAYLADHRSKRSGSRGRPFRDSSPLRPTFLMLLRSRRAIGRPLVTPGWPVAAAGRCGRPRRSRADSPARERG